MVLDSEYKLLFMPVWLLDDSPSNMTEDQLEWNQKVTASDSLYRPYLNVLCFVKGPLRAAILTK